MPSPPPSRWPCAPQHVLHAPADVWHDEPVETWHHVTEDEPPCHGETEPAREPDRDSWRSILDILLAEDQPPPAKPVAEPIGFAHNGFHVDDEQRFQSVDVEVDRRPRIAGCRRLQRRPGR